MNFRVALAAAAVLTASGAANAQAFRSQPPVDKVVVSLDGKPMRAVRAELARAAEAVCRRSEEAFVTYGDSGCFNATYASALRRAKLAYATPHNAPAATQVASR